MIEYRRRFLAGSSAATLLSSLIGLGLLTPTRAIAGTWNKTAFRAPNITEALSIYGGSNASPSRDIVISAPEVAENGAKVEIEITCHLPGTHSLAIFADKNPTPLCAELAFSPNMLPYTRIQVKLAESTRVRVIAKTQEGKTHVTFREIKVTLGGCGV